MIQFLSSFFASSCFSFISRGSSRFIYYVDSGAERAQAQPESEENNEAVIPNRTLPEARKQLKEVANKLALTIDEHKNNPNENIKKARAEALAALKELAKQDPTLAPDSFPIGPKEFSEKKDTHVLTQPEIDENIFLFGVILDRFSPDQNADMKETSENSLKNSEEYLAKAIQEINTHGENTDLSFYLLTKDGKEQQYFLTGDETTKIFTINWQDGNGFSYARKYSSLPSLTDDMTSGNFPEGPLPSVEQKKEDPLQTAITRINTYAPLSDMNFKLPLNGELQTFFLMKDDDSSEKGNYHVYPVDNNGVQGQELGKYEDLTKLTEAIQNGNFGRKVVKETVQKELSAESTYQKLQGEIGPFKKTDTFKGFESKNDTTFMTFDWGSVQLKTLSNGEISYEITAPNIGGSGINNISGFASDVPSAMAQIAHARDLTLHRLGKNWNEVMEKHFRRLTSKYSYTDKAVENKIGKLTSFKVMRKKVEFSLDWGKDNNNPLFRAEINAATGKISYLVSYRYTSEFLEADTFENFVTRIEALRLSPDEVTPREV